MYSEVLSAIVNLPSLEPVPRYAYQWTTAGGVVCRGEGTMAEAQQSVQQGECLATTTSPTSTLLRRRGRRRLVWLVVLLLGCLAGTAAWQRWDLLAIWQRLSMQPVVEQVAPSPPSQATDVAIIHESQLQQLTIEPVR